MPSDAKEERELRDITQKKKIVRTTRKGRGLHDETQKGKKMIASAKG